MAHGSTQKTIPELVTLLYKGSEAEKGNSAYALAHCSFNDSTAQTTIREAHAIPALVALLLNSEPERTKKWAICTLGHLADKNPENQKAIKETGAIPILVDLLCTGSATIKKFTALALRNLADDSPENQKAICGTATSALNLLAANLEDTTLMEPEQCAWMKVTIHETMAKKDADAPTAKQHAAFAAAMSNPHSTAYKIFAIADAKTTAAHAPPYPFKNTACTDGPTLKTSKIESARTPGGKR